ncbi:MAG: hypothetical protein Q7J78_06260 [Clostridiales bacterium]|nr:hypothetical protein [Clostridiales bacterium]
MLRDIKKSYHDLVILDCTHPDVALSNGEFYCQQDIPFVMGTTFRTPKVREKLEAVVENSKIPAAIVSNFALPIIALQSQLECFATHHEGSLAGSSLYILESHAGPDIEAGFKGKADASGTAATALKSFKKMGLPDVQINMLRKWSDQNRLFSLEPEYRHGHAYHLYSIYDFKANMALLELGNDIGVFLASSHVFTGYSTVTLRNPEIPGLGRTSPDETVQFALEIKDFKDKGASISLQHLVKGRAVYGPGAMAGLRLINEKAKQGTQGLCYSGNSVLEYFIQTPAK